MVREQTDAGYEWVNAWAASAMAEASAAMKGEPPRIATVTAAPAPMTAVSAPAPVISIAPALVPDQLLLDIAEIERARDALEALPIPSFAGQRRTQAFTLVPSRASDMAPVVVGGVLALVMLTVFGAAAAMTKLAR